MSEGGFLPPLLLELRANATEAIAGIREVGGEVRKLEDQTTGSMSRSAKAFHGFAGAGKAALLGVAGASAVVAIAGVKMATDFQSQMTLLRTAGGETAEAMKAIEPGILSLAKSTGTSVANLSEGMYTISKAAGLAGWTGAQQLLVLKAAAEGAKAENVDLGTATNALTSVMMSYHMSADQAVQVQNMLIAGAGAAKTTMQAYAGSLSTVIPVASAAGISFAQVAGGIATLTQHGTSAEEATQELANTIRSLQAPNAVAQKAMAAMGISVTDLSSNLGKRGLTGTLDIVTDAIAKHTQGGMVALSVWKQSQQATADLKTMIGNMPGPLSQMAQAVQNNQMSLKDFSANAAKLGPDAQVMAKQFVTLFRQSTGFSDALKAGQPSMVTFAGELSKIMGGATGMNTALMLGGENMGAFKTAVEKVSVAGKAGGKDIETWAQTSKTFKVQIDRVIQTLEVFALQVGQKIIPIVTNVVTWFAKHKTVTEVLAGVIGGVLVLAIGVYIASMISAAVATVAATWPILAIIAACAALVVGVLYMAKHWRQVWADIKTWTHEGWTWINDHFLKFIPLFRFVEAGIKLLADHWHQIWDGIKSTLNVAWNDVIRPVFGFIKSVGIDPTVAAIHYLSQHWDTIWHAIQDTLNTAWSVLDRIFGWIKTLGIDPIVGSIQAFEGIWDGVWGAVKTAIQDAWNFIKPIVDQITSAVDAASHAAGAVSGFAHRGGGANPLNWFADGGYVPAAPGAPMVIGAHGGEYVLSNEMLAGRQPIDNNVVQKILAGQQQGQQRPAAAAVSVGAPSDAGGHTINVGVQTDASPYRIGAELGWVMRTQS